MLETFCQVNYHFFGNISKLTTWFMEINLWMNVLVHLESPSLDFVVIVLWKLKDWIAAGSFSAGLKLFREVFIWCEVSKESKVAHLGPSPAGHQWLVNGTWAKFSLENVNLYVNQNFTLPSLFRLEFVIHHTFSSVLTHWIKYCRIVFSHRKFLD